MDADLSRLPAGTGGWRALVEHALSLGDLAEVDYLELKGPLSFGNRTDRKRSAVVLSRAILGMANRMPDLAAKHLGGSGVVFIGIDKSRTIVGTDEVDGAVLCDVLDPYVGEDGPRWDHQFIDHSDGLILAVVVDPPRWGDRIHACRKSYSDDSSQLAVRDGEVFVRLPGKTRPATSHDLSNLEERRARSPHTGAQVRVTYDGKFDRTSRANVRELVDIAVAEAADDLVKGAPVNSARSVYGTGVHALIQQSSARPDRRTPEEFRAEVSKWKGECADVADDVVTEFLRYSLAPGTFGLRNESDRYLEGVRVQVSFRPGVFVLMASDTDYCDHDEATHQFQIFQVLPQRPPRYGALTRFAHDFGRWSLPKPTSLSAPAPDFVVEESAGGYLVSWYVGDLPPRGTVRGLEGSRALRFSLTRTSQSTTRRPPLRSTSAWRPTWLPFGRRPPKVSTTSLRGSSFSPASKSREPLRPGDEHRHVPV